MIRPLRTQPRNDYPTSDGKPMAETDLHRDLMMEIIETLKWWFRGRPEVYVSGNLLVFHEKGNKRVHVSPDVFVVPGIGNHRRENYLLWEEGRGLDFVIETTSKTTMMEDIETKYNLYAGKLAVKEYVLFDPREEYLKPSFQVYRRFGAGFRRVKPVAGRYTSKVLGLELERDGTQLRLRDPATGERLPTPAERAEAEANRADAEANRADAEANRADTAEAEVERLRRELARLRGGV
jgi:Uma2 family endonuclease